MAIQLQSAAHLAVQIFGDVIRKRAVVRQLAGVCSECVPRVKEKKNEQHDRDANQAISYADTQAAQREMRSVILVMLRNHVMNTRQATVCSLIAVPAWVK